MSDNGQGDKTPRLFSSNESTVSSKSSILKKKLQAEKLALELKIGEQQCGEQIPLMRTEALQRKKLLEIKKKAEESKLEYEYEDAMAQEECLSNDSPKDDKELSELPIDSVNDRVARLIPSSTSDAKKSVADGQLVEETNATDPDCEAKVETTEPSKTVIVGEPRRPERSAMADDGATGNPSTSTSELDQLFEKILPAFVKIVKPSVPKYNRNPLEYSKFKAAFKVEVDKNEVYDDTEKLKFLLDAVEGSAKSCLSKFMPASDKYKEAWTALDERFGRVDKVVSAAKKRVEKSLVIAKENSGQIGQYQEIVTELIGVHIRNINLFMSLNRRSQKQLLLNFLCAYAGDGQSLSKENPGCQLGCHLDIGWNRRQKSVILCSDGCLRSKSGNGLTHLKVISLGLDCLQERQENILHALEM